MRQKHTKESGMIDGLDAEELASLHKFLSAQRALKRKRQDEGSASEAGNPSDNCDDDDIVYGGSSGNIDANKSSWVGSMIKAPVGERGRGTNARGRLGFKNDDIFRLMGITQQKWDQYLYTAHRLINHHFDTTMNWTANTQNNPNGWRIIISEMQDCHPRFLFHEGNWAIRHIAINHLANMNKRFKKMDPDSDVEVYRRCTTKKAIINTPRPTPRPMPRPTHIRGARSQQISKASAPVPPLAKPPSISPPIDLSIDSGTETDFELSDLYDNEPPNKRQKRGTETVHQPLVRRSQERSQKAPVTRSKGKARALPLEPESEILPLHPKRQPRRVVNPRNPYSGGLRRSPRKHHR